MELKIMSSVSKNGFMDVCGVTVSKKDLQHVRRKLRGRVAICRRTTHQEAMVLRKGEPFDCKETIVVTSSDYQAAGCRTARTLSSLLSSGVEVITAFSIAREVIQNSYFREVLAEAQKQIQKGLQIAPAFSQNEHLYPPLMGELISVGEETGGLSTMLLQVATFYENEVEQKTKNMSTIIEPILMVVIGIAVGFFALSVISPIYSLSNAI